MHGLDELGLLWIIAERLADEPDSLGERGLAHVSVFPRDVHQRLLRDDAAGALDEMPQDCQGAWRQPDFFSAAGEQPVRKVEAERAEVDDRSRARMKDQRPRLIVLLHDWNNCIDRGRLRTYWEDSAAQVRKKSGRDHPGVCPYVFFCP